MTHLDDSDTIVAIATPPGRGGVGIVRVSGKLAHCIAKSITHKNLSPASFLFTSFRSKDNAVIDEGIALYFQNPHSFTGEDVVEFQGHGSPWTLNQLVETAIHYGARLAHPGEFSARAFLNDKMDLTQAEAVADLVDAETQQAASAALQSLSGEFSKRIRKLLDEVVQLRVYVEAAIDFPEEEINFLADEKIQKDLENIKSYLEKIYQNAYQGSLLREGVSVVIAGKPNVGKSSLLNALSEKEAAIVTDIAGTTRDVLREHIHVDGMPLHIIDTAGLRDDADVVEQEGIRRAYMEMERADLILLVVDITQQAQVEKEYQQMLTQCAPCIVIYNKMDLQEKQKQLDDAIYISAKQKTGLKALKNKIKEVVGFKQATQGVFSARARHVSALRLAMKILGEATIAFQQHEAGELLAEDLRRVQQCLSEITGEFTTDDLLGEIFSSFCIGK